MSIMMRKLFGSFLLPFQHGCRVLIAGAVLAAGALTASLAFASPTTYELVPDPALPSVISGTFILDPDEQEPYRDWKFITELAPDFTLGSTSVVDINAFACCPGHFELGGAQSGVDPWQLFVHVNFESNVGGSYEIQIVRIDHVTFEVLNNFDEFGTLRVKDMSVPEPTAAVLLATGLLILVGSRWLPRRGAAAAAGVSPLRRNLQPI